MSNKKKGSRSDYMKILLIGGIAVLSSLSATAKSKFGLKNAAGAAAAAIQVSEAAKDDNQKGEKEPNGIGVAKEKSEQKTIVPTSSVARETSCSEQLERGSEVQVNLLEQMERMSPAELATGFNEIFKKMSTEAEADAWISKVDFSKMDAAFSWPARNDWWPESFVKLARTLSSAKRTELLALAEKHAEDVKKDKIVFKGFYADMPVVDFLMMLGKYKIYKNVEWKISMKEDEDENKYFAVSSMVFDNRGRAKLIDGEDANTLHQFIHTFVMHKDGICRPLEYIDKIGHERNSYQGRNYLWQRYSNTKLQTCVMFGDEIGALWLYGL